MPTTTCTGPDCGRPAICHGLCAAHYRQSQRGPTLRPLRGAHGQRGAEPLVRLPGLRVSAGCAAAVGADPPGARSALESWASTHKAPGP